MSESAALTLVIFCSLITMGVGYLIGSTRQCGRCTRRFPK